MKRHLCLVILTLFIMHSAGAQAPSVVGLETQCTANVAAGHACSNVDMLSRLSMADMQVRYLNDVWGWVDPDSDREYVLQGSSAAVVFVDVTDPVNPIYVGQLPGHDPQVHNLWRDMKVYKNYMYVTVDGLGQNGVQIFDLTQLRAYSGSPIIFEETAAYEAIHLRTTLPSMRRPASHTSWDTDCLILWYSLINVAGVDCISWTSKIRSTQPTPAALPISKPAELVVGTHTMSNA